MATNQIHKIWSWSKLKVKHSVEATNQPRANPGHVSHAKFPITDNYIPNTVIDAGQVPPIAPTLPQTPFRQWGLTFIALAVFMVATVSVGAVGIAYSQNRLQTYHRSQTECLALVAAAEQNGLVTNSTQCLPQSDWEVALAVNYTVVDNNLMQAEFNNQEKKLADQAQTLESKIDLIQQSLLALQAEFTVVEKPTNRVNLVDLLTARQAYYQQLLNLGVERFSKISIQLQDYDYLVTKNPVFDLQPDKQYIAQYRQLTQELQLLQFPELQSKFGQLRNILIANNGRIYAQSAVDIKLLSDASSLINPNPTLSQNLKSLFGNVNYPNTKPVAIKEAVVTGNRQIDEYILQMSLKRGYQTEIQVTDEKMLITIDENLLQPEATQAWSQMHIAAVKDGVDLKLVSGYRSVVDQQQLFRDRLEKEIKLKLKRDYTPDDILSGKVDDVIEKILQVTSPPGYSQHHSGFAIDMADISADNTTTVFNSSKADQWLSKNNYANARKFGFIASYPKGIKNSGPDPEPWHYMWVGTKNTQISQ